MGVDHDAVKAKLKLVGSFQTCISPKQKYTRIVKRPDKYGTPDSAWIYVQTHTHEEPPDLVAYLGGNYRHHQGHRTDVKPKRQTRLEKKRQHRRCAGDAVAEEEGKEGPVRKQQKKAPPEETRLTTAALGNGTMQQPMDTQIAPIAPQVTGAGAGASAWPQGTFTLVVEENAHIPSIAGSQRNVEARQLMAEIASIASSLGGQRINHMMQLTAKFYANRMDVVDGTNITHDVFNSFISCVTPSPSTIQRTPAMQLRVEVVRQRRRLSRRVMCIGHDHGHRSNLHMLVFQVSHSMMVNTRLGTFCVCQEFVNNAVVGGTGEEIFEFSKLQVEELDLIVGGSNLDGATSNGVFCRKFKLWLKEEGRLAYDFYVETNCTLHDHSKINETAFLAAFGGADLGRPSVLMLWRTIYYALKNTDEAHLTALVEELAKHADMPTAASSASAAGAALAVQDAAVSVFEGVSAAALRKVLTDPWVEPQLTRWKTTTVAGHFWNDNRAALIVIGTVMYEGREANNGSGGIVKVWGRVAKWLKCEKLNADCTFTHEFHVLFHDPGYFYLIKEDYHNDIGRCGFRGPRIPRFFFQEIETLKSWVGGPGTNPFDSTFTRTTKALAEKVADEQVSVLQKQIRMYLSTALRVAEKKAEPWLTMNMLVVLGDNNLIAVPCCKAFILLYQQPLSTLEEVVKTVCEAPFVQQFSVEREVYDLEEFLLSFLRLLSENRQVMSEWPLFNAACKEQQDLFAEFHAWPVSGTFSDSERGDVARTFVATLWGNKSHAQSEERGVKAAGSIVGHGHSLMSEEARRAKQLLQSQSKDEAYEIQQRVVEARRQSNPGAEESKQASRFRITQKSSLALMGAFDLRRVTAEEAEAAPKVGELERLRKSANASAKAAAMVANWSTSGRKRIDEVKELASSDPAVPAAVMGRVMVSTLRTMLERVKCCETFGIDVPAGTGYHGYPALIKAYCEEKGQWDRNDRDGNNPSKRKYWVESFVSDVDVGVLEQQDTSVGDLDVSEILGQP